MKQKLNILLFVSVLSLGLLGGISYLPLFESGLSIDDGYIPMAPATSISFLVTTLILLVWVKYTKKFYRNKKYLGLIIFAVALFGFLEVVNYLFGIEYSFESYFFPDFGYLDKIPLGRMSPVTGFCFLLSSGALLILLSQNKTSKRSHFVNIIKNIFTSTLCFVSFLFIIPYFYQAPLLYNIENIIPMALSTSLSFLYLSGILIINDNRNHLVELFTQSSPSTTLIRFITPFTVLSVFVTGLIQHFMFTVGFINHPTFITVSILILLAITCGLMTILLTKKLIGLQERVNINLHQYKYMVTSSSDMQALLDADFFYLAVNEAYVEKLQLTIEQVVGKHFSDVLGNVYFDTEFIDFAERSLAGEVVVQEKWIACISGQRTFIELKIAPYYQDDGNIYGITINARDNTQLKHHQDNLEKSNLVIENSPVVAFRWRTDFSVEHVSSNVEFFGYQASDLLSGKINYLDIVHPQDIPRLIKEVNYFTENGLLQFIIDYRIVSPAGRVFWIDARSTIKLDEYENFLFYQGVIIDITERKHAEIKLEQSNTLIHNVINATPDLIYVKNMDHQYILANNAFAQSLKHSAGFLMGKTDQQLGFTDTKTKKIKINAQKFFYSNINSISNCRSFYGDKKVIDGAKFPLRKDDGDTIGVIYIGHDVTEHINNLAKISKQQKELAQTIDAINDAVIAIDDLGLIQNCNRATERIFGHSAEELIGRNVSLLMSGINGWGYDGEVIGINKKKQNFPVHLAIAALPTNRHERKRFVCVCHDLSESKQHEKLLNRTQKMEALGQLTGGIAHDYNNMLGVILGYSDILKSQLKEQPLLFNYVDQINHAGKRGAKLTRKLLSFSRQTPDSSQESDINELIRRNKELLYRTLLSVELKFNLNDDINKVRIDKNSFEDVLLNIAINAMHAMPEGGVLTLTTCEEELSNVQATSFNIEPGKYVKLLIEDTGIGMSKAIQDKIFEPFYSTKGEQGSGLGLAQVYGFMKSSMGAINVDSELGKGTTFSLYFPILKASDKANDKASDKASDKAEKLNVRGNESILIVDDEPSLRNLAKTILMAKGYHVLTAENGEDALIILAEHTVDLMLSDIIMPKMNGYLLAEQAQKLYPTLKILLASGFRGDQVGNKIKLDEAIIEKPYKNDFLLHKVRNCLDKKDAKASDNKNQTTNQYSEQLRIEKVTKSSQVNQIMWTNEMSIDNGGIIDIEHKSLLMLINRCQVLLGTEDYQQSLQETINELMHHIQDHFVREELLMKRCNYPYAKNHNNVHEMITKQINQKLNTCSEKEILLWLSTEMSEWLIEHIMIMDKHLYNYSMKTKPLKSNSLKSNIEGDDNAQ
ncbi:PAS domain S-box protein [Colwellia hornerae]|uniref:histidine kinase n=1 Tax=Colwellia hornerae TaxID=89402 RepID=A0A5C6QI53_9GAMM|nr:PAS domain S-box protein [Colwellia hornerae]TWX52870.1 PAS domain S-box protein [Colwellia hornerae]TWX59224.1 PAS domain S-box protein [Colwellia hornerae]TWX68252.1 PAS domain S-box protein [Colwellia hornerae]